MDRHRRVQGGGQNATFTGGKATGVEGYETLNLGSLSANPDLDKQWQGSPSPGRGPGDLPEGAEPHPRRAGQVGSRSRQAGRHLHQPGDRRGLQANSEVGLYTTAAFQPGEGETGANQGQFLTPGWPVFVGIDNYTKIFTDPGVRANFIPIMLWSFAFAIGTVLMQFVFGLLLALVMQEKAHARPEGLPGAAGASLRLADLR